MKKLSKKYKDAVSKIEKNKRQVTDYELACICKCLSVTPDELLDFSNFEFIIQ